MKFALTIFLIALVVQGCANTGYLADRWRDFKGIVEVDLGVSQGVQAYVGVSHIAQVGWGSYWGERAGLRAGRVGTWQEERSEFGLGPVYLHEVDWQDRSQRLVGHQHAGYLDPAHVEYPWEWGSTVTDRRLGDVGIAANAGFVGFSLFFRTAEFFDFIGGWFGMDLLQDDLGNASREDLIAALESADPQVRLRAARLLAELEGKTFGYRSYSQPQVHTRSQQVAEARWLEKEE